MYVISGFLDEVLLLVEFMIGFWVEVSWFGVRLGERGENGLRLGFEVCVLGEWDNGCVGGDIGRWLVGKECRVSLWGVMVGNSGCWMLWRKEEE